MNRSASATRRLPDAERSVATASKQISGPPVSIAGEAFMTLPPMVPALRVAWLPTMADASARAVNSSHAVLEATMSAWVASAPSTSPPSCSRIPRSSDTRWMATRASGSGALPPRAPTTRSVPPAIGRAPAAIASSTSSTEVAAV